jgi:hypothetical protein
MELTYQLASQREAAGLKGAIAAGADRHTHNGDRDVRPVKEVWLRRGDENAEACGARSAAQTLNAGLTLPSNLGLFDLLHG